MERRFHNPYRHWLSGFIFEVAVFSAFTAIMILTAAGAAWIFG